MTQVSNHRSLLCRHKLFLFRNSESVFVLFLSLTPQVGNGTPLPEGDTTFLIHSTLSTLASKAASPTKKGSSGSRQNTSSNQVKRNTSSSSIKRETSSSSVGDRNVGPDLATRGEGNELKDVFAKLQKRTAAEEVQMHVACTNGSMWL